MVSDGQKERRARRSKRALLEASSEGSAGAPYVILAAQQPWSFSAIMLVYWARIIGGFLHMRRENH